MRLKETSTLLVILLKKKKQKSFLFSPPLSNSKFKYCAPCRGRVVRVARGWCIFYLAELPTNDLLTDSSPVMQKSNENKQIATFLLPKPQKIFWSRTLYLTSSFIITTSFILSLQATCNRNFITEIKFLRDRCFPPCFVSLVSGGGGGWGGEVLPKMTYTRRLHQTKRPKGLPVFRL